MESLGRKESTQKAHGCRNLDVQLYRGGLGWKRTQKAYVMPVAVIAVVTITSVKLGVHMMPSCGSSAFFLSGCSDAAARMKWRPKWAGSWSGWEGVGVRVRREGLL